MNNKGIGTIFCLISAMLMCTRYIAAAIFMSGVSSWDSDLFANGLKFIGSPLKIASVLALITGIIFLSVGIYQDLKKEKKVNNRIN